jgi:hypothetical protein
MGKHTYLYQHQFTGLVKAYKTMSSIQAKAANLELSTELNNCRWVLDPLATAGPLVADMP